MDFPVLSNLIRRSRHRALASDLDPRDVKWVKDARNYLEPRFYASLNEYSPSQLSSLESIESLASVESESLAKLASNAAAAAAAKATSTLTTTKASTTARVAAQAATIGTTRTDSAASLTKSASTSTTSSTSAKSSSAVSSLTPSSSTPKTTLPTTPSTSPTSAIITSTPTTSSVQTITSPITSLNSTAVAAASSPSTTSGLSTGGIVGIVLAVIVGLVVVGSAIGWAYRKYTSRAYSSNSAWSHLQDNDVTPFPPSSQEKSFDASQDVYGSSQAPVIGSRRALALARQNFNPDGSIRPASDIMIQREGNRAGLGSGLNPYNNDPMAYGLDAQGRPYNPHVGRAPMPHTLNDHYENVVTDLVSISPPSNSRQLLGPGYTPAQMGRPGAPATPKDLMQHEAFADFPSAHPVYDPTYDEEENYTPKSEHSNHQLAGNGKMTSPKGYVQMPLPALVPMSPLMSNFIVGPEDDSAAQKRMYGEVARAAGINEPVTPHSINDSLVASTSSTNTTSSFSAHDPTPVIRLPPQQLAPPQPFVHGQPLSPLIEVVTPSTSTTNRAQIPSPVPSSNLHEYNPFDNLPIPPPRASSGSLAPPYSASTSGATGVPSPRFPPPTPGGMSVPGSVGGSPSPPRWDGDSGRPLSLRYDDDDAYDGI